MAAAAKQGAKDVKKMVRELTTALAMRDDNEAKLDRVGKAWWVLHNAGWSAKGNEKIMDALYEAMAWLVAHPGGVQHKMKLCKIALGLLMNPEKCTPKSRDRMVQWCIQCLPALEEAATHDSGVRELLGDLNQVRPCVSACATTPA